MIILGAFEELILEAIVNIEHAQVDPTVSNIKVVLQLASGQVVEGIDTTVRRLEEKTFVVSRVSQRRATKSPGPTPKVYNITPVGRAAIEEAIRVRSNVREGRPWRE